MCSSGRQVGSLDEAESSPRAAVTDEERGGRQEQLVDDTCLEEAAESVRSGLAEDPAVSPRTERAQDDVGSDAPPRPKRNHGRCRRHASVEVLGSGVARQDECSRPEQRMSDVDLAAPREDGDLGGRRRSQAVSEL